MKNVTLKELVQSIIAEVGTETPTPEAAYQALRGLAAKDKSVLEAIKAWARSGRLPAVPKGTPPGVLAAITRAVEATREALYSRRPGLLKDFRGRDIDARPTPPGEVPAALLAAQAALNDLVVEEVVEGLEDPGVYESSKRNWIPQGIQKVLELHGIESVAYSLRDLAAVRSRLYDLLERAFMPVVQAVKLVEELKALQARVVNLPGPLPSGLEPWAPGSLIERGSVFPSWMVVQLETYGLQLRNLSDLDAAVERIASFASQEAAWLEKIWAWELKGLALIDNKIDQIKAGRVVAHVVRDMRTGAIVLR